MYCRKTVSYPDWKNDKNPRVWWCFIASPCVKNCDDGRGHCSEQVPTMCLPNMSGVIEASLAMSWQNWSNDWGLLAIRSVFKMTPKKKSFGVRSEEFCCHGIEPTSPHQMYSRSHASHVQWGGTLLVEKVSGEHCTLHLFHCIQFKQTPVSLQWISCNEFSLLDALLWDIRHVPTCHIAVESSGTSVLYWMPVSCNSSLVKMQFLVHILVQHQTCCTKLSHCYRFT
jgi:hypothetical protein